MKRALFLLLALAVLSGAFVLLFSDPGAAPQVDPEGAAAHAAQHVPGELQPGEAARPPAADGIVGRSETVAPSAGDTAQASADDRSLLTVRVLRQDTREPLPHAAVDVLEPRPEQERELSEAFFTGTKPDDLFARYGKRYTADARGEVRVPQPSEFAVFAGARDDLYGVARWNRGEASEGAALELELAPDPVVRIRVRDERGTPVPGVPVSIRLGGNNNFSFDVARQPTGPEGIAEFRHVAAFTRVVTPFESADFLAALAVLLPQPVSFKFDFAQLPAEPIELVLPPTGSVRVRLLDVDGKAYAARQLVALSIARSNPEDDDDFLAPGMPGFDAAVAIAEGGAVSYPFVGLGLMLQASAQFPEAPKASQARAAGPQRAGEAVEFELRRDVDFLLLIAQILHDEKPVAERDFMVRVIRSSEEGEWDESKGARTDAEGRVRVGVLANETAGEAVRIEWRLQSPPGEPMLFAETRVERLEVGEVDLGVLRLQPAPILAAGIVLGPDGAPLPSAGVVAMRKRVWGEAPDQFHWEGMWSTQVQAARDGRFTIYGTWTEPELRLQAHAPSLREVQVDVVPGARDVRMQLGAAATLGGRLLVDPGVDIGSLYLELRLDGLAEDDREGSIGAGVDRDTGRFTFQGARPGTGTLRIRPQSFQVAEDAIFELAGVQIGGPPDPRLDPIDLRGRLHGCMLQVVGEGGGTINEVQAWPTRRPEETNHGWRGRVSVLSLEPLGEIVVLAPGWRETRFTPTGPEATVELRRGLQVQVTTDATAVLRAGKRLGCFLVHEDGGGSWARGARLPFDDGGTATLTVSAPGVYRVEFLISADQGLPSDPDSWWGFSWVQRDDAEVQRITVEDAGGLQSFRVAPPPAERLDEAIRNLESEVED